MKPPCLLVPIIIQLQFKITCPGIRRETNQIFDRIFGLNLTAKGTEKLCEEIIFAFHLILITGIGYGMNAYARGGRYLRKR